MDQEKVEQFKGIVIRWLQERSPKIYGYLAIVLLVVIMLLWILTGYRLMALLWFFLAAFIGLILAVGYYLIFSDFENPLIGYAGWLVCLLCLMVSFYALQALRPVKTSYTGNEQSVEIKSDETGLFALNSSAIKDTASFNHRKIGILSSMEDAKKEQMIAWLDDNAPDAQLVEYDASFQMAQDLKGVVIDGVILDSAGLRAVSNYQGLEDFQKDVKLIHQSEWNKEESQSDDGQETPVTSIKPLTLLLSATDEWQDPWQGQQAIYNTLLTLNFETKKALLTTVPSNTHIETACAADCSYSNDDELNIIAQQSTEGMVQALQDALDIKIDGWMLYNWTGWNALIEAFEGLEINNPAEFGSGDQHYPAGPLVLEGYSARQYGRRIWSNFAGSVSEEQNQMRLALALLEEFAKADPSTLQPLFETSVLTSLPSFSLNALLEAMVQTSSWQVYHDELTGSEQWLISSSLGYSRPMIEAAPMMVQRVDLDIQSVLNGETPVYATALEQPELPESEMSMEEGANGEVMEDMSIQEIQP